MNSITAAGYTHQAIKIDQSGMFDLSSAPSFHISEAPEEVYQNYITGMKSFLEGLHSSIENYHGNPVNDTYAEIMKDGKVIAKIDNNGAVESSNALGSVIRDIVQGAKAPKGPALAQYNAEQIAEALGGDLVIKDTAMTELAYAQAPKPYMSINYEAMQADPLFESLMNLQKMRSAYTA